MRLGLIEFGDPYSLTATLVGALSERGVDVIRKLPEPPQSAREEAERLHRADCDGVLLTLGNVVKLDDVAEALLHIHCPILLATYDPESHAGQNLVAEAHALIGALAVASDSLSGANGTPAFVESWLVENSRANRQKGIEAALKLYGARLMNDTLEETQSFAVKLSWLRQFGVLIVGTSGRSEARPDDIPAPNGDHLGAITQRLLTLVSGIDSPRIMPVTGTDLRATAIADVSSVQTLAVISYDREEGRSARASSYYARVFRAAANQDGTFSIGERPHAFLTEDGDRDTPTFYATAGDCVGAMRSALNTLDISTLVLREV